MPGESVRLEPLQRLAVARTNFVLPVVPQLLERQESQRQALTLEGLVPLAAAPAV